MLYSINMYLLSLLVFSQTPTPHIINGVDTDILEYASSLSMQTLGQHFCGAVLISEYYALSAAHALILWIFLGSLCPAVKQI